MDRNVVILGIELSSSNCSVALLYNGQVTELSSSFGVLKSQKILAMIAQILKQHSLSADKLTALAFGAGPGSFTGLKIASCIVQGLHLTWQKPIIKISTLWGLALQGYQQFGIDYIISCIDAKMGQIYYGVYKVENNDTLLPIQEDAIIEVKKFSMPNQSSILVIGDGAEIVKNVVEQFGQSGCSIQYSVQYVRASSIVRLAEYCYNRDSGSIFNNDAEPIYLKLYD